MYGTEYHDTLDKDSSTEQIFLLSPNNLGILSFYLFLKFNIIYEAVMNLKF